MTRDEWAGHYRRLLTAYNKGPNAEQATIYFDALSSLPNGIIDTAINEIIRVRGTWPHVSDIREQAASLLASKTYEPPKCTRCGGNLWIDDQPRFFDGRSYETVRRCPDCYQFSPRSHVA